MLAVAWIHASIDHHGESKSCSRSKVEKSGSSGMPFFEKKHPRSSDTTNLLKPTHMLEKFTSRHFGTEYLHPYLLPAGDAPELLCRLLTQ